MHRQGSIAQRCSFDPGNADIDRHRLHVQAVTGHVVAVSSKIFVGLGRAIATDDIDFAVLFPEASREIVEKIKDLGIVVMDFSGAPVAKVVVKTVESVRHVAVGRPINNVDPFFGVNVEKVEAVV